MVSEVLVVVRMGENADHSFPARRRFNTTDESEDDALSQLKPTRKELPARIGRNRKSEPDSSH